jgi:cyclopropane fatty-acyl-phospholipid synthase-like methyltransferase
MKSHLLHKYRHLFDGKDVLEIGPGEGRQYHRVCTRATTYWIADISKAVTERYHYAYLIEDYSDDMGLRFDLIHFWFVLHHVLKEELDDFIGFVNRHIRPHGKILFNHPLRGSAAPDGMNTTQHVLTFKNVLDIKPDANTAVLVKAPLEIEKKGGYGDMDLPPHE